MRESASAESSSALVALDLGQPGMHSLAVVAPLRPAPRPTAPIRRALDIAGATLLLVLLAPVFAVLAFAVRLNSSGPIIYRQTRVGMNRRAGDDRRARVVAAALSDQRRGDRRVVSSAGKLYRILKFRTMVDGAEAKRGPTWASKNDDRITLVGKLLRRTRLDELPQLVNVLRGDMTFIGPRPERPFFVDRFCVSIPDYMERLTVVPGITGLAQVEHKYDANEEDVARKLHFDLAYLRNRSVGLDVRILWKTVRVVVSGHGAH